MKKCFLVESVDRFGVYGRSSWHGSFAEAMDEMKRLATSLPAISKVKILVEIGSERTLTVLADANFDCNKEA